MSVDGANLQTASEQLLSREHASTLSSFGEYVLQAMLVAAQSLEKEHLAILHEKEQAFRHSRSKLLGAAELRGSSNSPHIDEVDLEFEVIGVEHLRLEKNGSGDFNSKESDPAGVDQFPSRRTSIGNSVTFKLLDDWVPHTGDDTPDEDTTRIARLQYKASLTKMLDRENESLIAPHASRQMAQGCLDKIAINPTSVRRVGWDMMAAAVIGYEGFYTPMTVFDIPDSAFTHGIAVFIMFYWTVDMLVSLVSGYTLPDGAVEMRFRKMASKYLKTWFLFDLLVVSVDWLTLGPILVDGMGSDSDSRQSTGLLRIGKLARFARVLRFLRLLRMGKIGNVMRHVHDFIGMESTAIILNIAKNICYIFMINHILACIWFYLGAQDEAAGWLAPEGGRSEIWFQNYALSLHWSLSNFTPGGSTPSPQTLEELTFAVCVLFFALVVFSVFVSSTTTLISRLVNMKSARTRQLWILKGFLQENKLPTELRERVMRYVTTALGSKRDAHHRSDVELLSLLSQHLREEVEASLHLRTLHVHPFFKMLSLSGPGLVRKLCSEALAEVSLSRRDIVFNVGENADKMGFLECGVLEYVRMEHESSLLKPTDHFCEANLWTKWRCRGNMQADTDCDILELHGDEFRRCVKQQHVVADIVRDYACAFVETLNMIAAGSLAGPLTDVQQSYLNEEPVLKFLSQPWLQESSMASMNSSHFSSMAWNSKGGNSPNMTRHT